MNRPVKHPVDSASVSQAPSQQCDEQLSSINQSGSNEPSQSSRRVPGLHYWALSALVEQLHSPFSDQTLHPPSVTACPLSKVTPLSDWSPLHRGVGCSNSSMLWDKLPSLKRKRKCALPWSCSLQMPLCTNKRLALYMFCNKYNIWSFLTYLTSGASCATRPLLTLKLCFSNSWFRILRLFFPPRDISLLQQRGVVVKECGY